MTPTIYKTVEGHRTEMTLTTYDFLNRTLYLTGPVTDEAAQALMQQLRYCADSGDEDITLFVNSPGGSVPAGLALLDAMERAKTKCRLITCANGMAASMAAVILAGGSKGARFITPNSETMLHQPLLAGGAEGRAADIYVTAAHIMQMNERLARLLAAVTGRPTQQIMDDLARGDTWRTAEESVQYGLADHTGWPEEAAQ